MSQWNLYIPIHPVAVQSGRWGGHFYTNPKHRAYKEAILKYCEMHKPRELLSGPLALQMVFMFAWPKMAPKHKTRKIIDFRLTTPDLDNLKKGTIDALKKVVIGDDSQIVCDLGLFKLNGPVDGVFISLIEIKEAEQSIKDMAQGVIMACEPPDEVLEQFRELA
jgi:Holliday junction resolvase RusA-like endonuclease